MEDRDLRPRSGTPLTHYVIALFIALSAAGSLYFWLNKVATESASAVMSFDPNLAKHVDPGLASAAKPAVALANSILDDQAIAGLANQAHLSTSTDANQVGEFRAGIGLTQLSSNLLMVQFAGNDPDRSAANANAVAKALAAWTPAPADAPAADSSVPAAETQPQKAAPPVAEAQQQESAPPSVPAQTAPAESQSQQNQPAAVPSPADHSLTDSLGQLSAMLASTDRDLTRLAGAANAGSPAHPNPQAAYAESREQQLLKAQVNAAEKKLHDLRSQYTAGENNPQVTGRLTTIQQALDSILRGGEASKDSTDARGFTAAGTSATQLSRERSALSDAIGVVDKERHAIERTESAQPAAGGSSRASSAPAPVPAPAPPPTAQTTPSSEQTPATPPPDATAAQQQPGGNPLSIVHLASPTSPAMPLLAVLAGLVCGLLYLGGAIWAHNRGESEVDYDDDIQDYEEDEVASPHRFITPPSEPVNSSIDDDGDIPSGEDRAADHAATKTALAEAETNEHEAELISFRDAAGEGPAPPKAAALENRDEQASVENREKLVIVNEQTAPQVETLPDESAGPRKTGYFASDHEEAAVENRDELRVEARAETPHIEALQPASPEENEHAETADPFMEQLMRSLSQTSIGRMFEGGNQDAAGEPVAENTRRHGFL
jgi:hypothetical protein